jgi:hypothetical protein
MLEGGKVASGRPSNSRLEATPVHGADVLQAQRFVFEWSLSPLRLSGDWQRSNHADEDPVGRWISRFRSGVGASEIWPCRWRLR